MMRPSPRSTRTAEPGSTEAPAFYSIVYRNPGDAARETRAVPDYFHDLNLDQVVDAALAEWKDYDLAPFFHTKLDDLDAIVWRQEVFRDLERRDTMAGIQDFAARMRKVRARLSQADKARYRYEKERLFLGAVRLYCDAAEALSRTLTEAEPRSRGLASFRDYLAWYCKSEPFRAVSSGAASVEAGFAPIRYGVLIDGATVTVRPYLGEIDYTADVEATFERFRRLPAEDFCVRFPEWSGTNHIEAQIQDRVALLHPEPFRALDEFCAAHTGFLDDVIVRFDREVQFYVAWAAYLEPLAAAGLDWCYPQLSRTNHEVSARGTYDLCLARKLVAAKAHVVCNDFELHGRERVFVVSGPNNGGKTTFGRTFGQLHHLAVLGCPVAGREARLHHWDQLFVHFERQEDITNLRGKLLDDLVRIRGILDRITSDSVIIMNEIFSSTTIADAILLGRRVLERISRCGALGVCVTFLDELAGVDDRMVSMTSSVDPDDPAIRTFRIERRAPGGLTHALAIARKYRVDYASLRGRIRP